MIVQLTPDQISSNWPKLSEWIKESVPHVTGGLELAMTRIMTFLMDGSMQLWLAHEDKPKGIVLTTLSTDKVTFGRALLIYGLYKFEIVRPELIQSSFETLRIFAKENNCQSITAYTNDKTILNMANKIGANIEWSLIISEV